MLDKSVPYVEMLMRRKAGTAFEEYPLPEGYSYALYQAGDEIAWAKIEASVLEFDDEIEALLYFQEDWLPYKREIERRCLFIVAPNGEKVATATAWWGYTGVKRSPWIHWVAVKPEHQGKGLGKALASRVLRLLLDMEGDKDVYLNTQTWSHKAVGIYEKIGFVISPEKNIGGCANENYSKAVAMIDQLKAQQK